MIKGDRTIETSLVLTRNRKIVYAGERKIFSEKEYKVRKVPKMTILPPLIDAHVHLTGSFGETDEGVEARKAIARNNIRLSLANGIIALRDCGDRDFSLMDLKMDSQVSGIYLFASGPPITTPTGHLYHIGRHGTKPSELRKAVRELAREGANFIKVCATGGNITPESDPKKAQYSTRQLRAIVEEADRYRLKVVAHAHGSAGIENCIEAGVYSIEHCTFLGKKRGYDNEDTVKYLLDRIAEEEIYLCRPITHPDKVSKEEFERAASGERVEPYCFYKEAVNRGVNLVFATDAGIPNSTFNQFYKSLDVAVKMYGLTEKEVLKAVTTTPAEMLGLDMRIRQRSGANFTVVKGNPLEDITMIRNVRYVVKEGRDLYKNL